MTVREEWIGQLGMLGAPTEVIEVSTALFDLCSTDELKSEFARSVLAWLQVGNPYKAFIHHWSMRLILDPWHGVVQYCGAVCDTGYAHEESIKFGTSPDNWQAVLNEAGELAGETGRYATIAVNAKSSFNKSTCIAVNVSYATDAAYYTALRVCDPSASFAACKAAIEAAAHSAAQDYLVCLLECDDNPPKGNYREVFRRDYREAFRYQVELAHSTQRQYFLKLLQSDVFQSKG